LKIEIGRTTVANILLEEGIEPAPEREKKRTWKRFMNSHWDTLCACDFFSVEALGPFGTVRHMAFFVIELKSRAVEIAEIAVDPGEEWMKQVARASFSLPPASTLFALASRSSTSIRASRTSSPRWIPLCSLLA
jgi:hypothetical protein